MAFLFFLNLLKKTQYKARKLLGWKHHYLKESYFGQMTKKEANKN